MSVSANYAKQLASKFPSLKACWIWLLCDRCGYSINGVVIVCIGVVIVTSGVVIVKKWCGYITDICTPWAAFAAENDKNFHTLCELSKKNREPITNQKRPIFSSKWLKITAFWVSDTRICWPLHSSHNVWNFCHFLWLPLNIGTLSDSLFLI